MKLYAYARYSSENQRMESIDEQLREIQDYCNKHKHIILKSYCDYAKSGKYDTRPEYEKMLQDCILDNNCDGVIVFDITRFSRAGEIGIVDSIRLTQHNKILLSATEQISSDDFASKIMKYFKFLMAEEDITKLSNNVKRGKRETALAKEWNGGTAPLGYDVIDKKLVVNEKEAEAIRIIFDRVAKRYSYSMIIEELNNRGYRTKSGNLFKKTSIHEILNNKKYIGVLEYGKMITTKDPFTKTVTTRQANTEDMIIFENAIEPIIDIDLWEQVQRIKGQRKHSTKAKVKYNLTGKLICGVCGSSYVGSSMKTHDRRDYFYICSGKKNHNDCDNRNIVKDRLENIISDIVMQELKNGNLYNEISNIIDSYNAKDNDLIDKTNKDIDKKINKLIVRLNKAKEAYLNDVFSLNEYKEEQYQTNKQIELLKSQKILNNKININKKMLKLAFELLAEQIDNNTALELCDYINIKYDQITLTIGSKFLDKDIGGGADGN